MPGAKKPMRPRKPRPPSALREVALPQRAPLLGDAMFVTLATLDELVVFWNEHRRGFAFFCTGAPDAGNEGSILNRYEWVFGPSKWAVAAAGVRYGLPGGCTCEFYDWAVAEPGAHKSLWLQREQHREEKIAAGEWTPRDESEHRRRAPDVYRGWWHLRNPYRGNCDVDPMDWVTGEVADPGLASEDAAERLCEMVFDQWARDVAEVVVGTAATFEGYIKLQLARRAAGRAHYGSGDDL